MLYNLLFINFDDVHVLIEELSVNIVMDYLLCVDVVALESEVSGGISDYGMPLTY